MYIPIEVTAENFQSFESLSYSFSQQKTILVRGENLSDPGQESNGSGKSTIEEVIYYCCLGSSSSGKRDIKLIRRGCEISKISLKFYNTISKTFLRIERELYKKKSSTLSIFVNEINQRDKFPSVPEGNKFLLGLLGVSSEDLQNFYLINRDKFKPFFKLTDVESRDLISRFTNVNYLQKIPDTIIAAEITKLEEEKSGLQEELVVLEKDLVSLNSKKSTYEEQIETIKGQSSSEEFEKVKAESVLLLQGELRVLEEEVKVYKKVYDDEDALQDALQITLIHVSNGIVRLSKFDYLKKITDIDSQILLLTKKRQADQDSISLLSSQITDFSESVAPLRLTLAGKVTCPKCSSEFIPGDVNANLSEIESVIREVEEAIESLSLQKTPYQEKITKSLETESSLRKEKTKYSQQSSKRDQLVNRLRLEKAKTEGLVRSQVVKIDSTRKLLGEKRQAVLDKEVEISKVQKAEPEDNTILLGTVKGSIKKTEEEIVKKVKEIQDKEKEILEVDDLLAEKRVWVLNFKQFYIYLTNKSLSTIQSLCNSFLERIETNLRIKFEGFKMLADKTVKEKITAVIYRDGEEEEDWRCFSGGERGKLIFSTIFAFQHLINMNCKSGGIDLLFIDEVLDSVDGVGMRSFVESLNKLKKTILITTHISMKERDEHTLLIQKVNDKSYIV